MTTPEDPDAFFSEMERLLVEPGEAWQWRQAVQLAEAAVPPAGADDEFAAVCHGLRCQALRQLFGVTGDPADIDAAVEAAALAWDLTDDADSGMIFLNELGRALQLRFEAYGRLADLDAEIDVFNLAVRIADQFDDKPMAVVLRGNLSNALRSRHAVTSRADDLDGAIDAARHAVEALTPELPIDRHLGARTNLGAALAQRYEQTGVRTDVEQAVVLLRDAVTLCPPDEPQRARILCSLVQALRLSFEAGGDAQLLDEAVGTAEESVRLVGAHDPASSLCHGNLSLVRYLRYQLHGSDADLDATITTAREALRTADPGDPARLLLLCNLGAALYDRVDRNGDAAVLEEAIAVGRAGAATGGPDHPAHPRSLINLANALLLRAQLTGSRPDLDEGLAAARAAMELVPPGPPWRDVLVNTTANGLMGRYQRGGGPDDLAEAADLFRGAAQHGDEQRVNRPLLLNGLALTLLRRFEDVGDPADLDEAADALRTARRVAGPGAALDPTMALNLATVLFARYEVTGDESDRAEALTVTGETLERIAPDHSVGGALRYRHGTLLIEGEAADEAAAQLAFRDAALVLTAAPWLRATAARDWVNTAISRSDWDAAQAGIDTLFAVLPLLVEEGLGLPDRQRNLTVVRGLGSGAAAVALQRGDVERAWTGLEQGRAILLGQALDLRADRALPAGLAAEVAEVRRALGTPPPAATAPDEAVLADRDARRGAAARWRTLLGRVRAEPGLERFGLPPTVAELREAAGDHVVVAVNVAFRCDALILTRDGVDSVPLPRLSLVEAVEKAEAYLSADGRPAEILEWLWDVAARPVLDRLGTDRRRVQWIMTGPLSVLPIHAAGRAGDTVLDRVVSSYTPSVRSLRTGAGRRVPGPSLVVGIDATDLRHAVTEARGVAGKLPAPVELFCDGEATRDVVLDRLRTAVVAHFACHAVGADDPGESCLRLAGEPLDVRAVGALELGDAWLVMLSTCESAYGGTALLDESIHIASAFRAAGFAHAVGTLWPVADRVASLFVQFFYDRLAAGAPPAEATHAATLRLRERYPRFPQLWAGYLHFGT